jgi:hypothetical protein
MILQNGVLILAAVNLVLNVALSLMILLRCPHVMWRTTIRHPEHLREKPDLRTTEKGETSNEQSLG